MKPATLILTLMLVASILMYHSEDTHGHTITRPIITEHLQRDVHRARARGQRVTPGMIRRHRQRLNRRGRRHNATHQPAPPIRGTTSCYGDTDGLMGNTMANGQTLTPSTLGVAHKTKPLGQRRTAHWNGRTITITITDRGPYTPGRTWDLTIGAVQALGIPTCRDWGHPTL